MSTSKLNKSTEEKTAKAKPSGKAGGDVEKDQAANAEVQKKLDGYVKEVKELIRVADITLEKLCKTCASAAAACGIGPTTKRFESEFPIFKKIGFKFFMLAGQGKTSYLVTTIPVLKWRERVVALPKDVQDKFFNGELEVHDYRTEKVTKPGYQLDQIQWKTVWNERTGNFRPLPEQLAWIHNDKDANKKRKRYVVRSDGSVRVTRACVLSLTDLVDIFFEISFKADTNLMELVERRKGK